MLSLELQADLKIFLKTSDDQTVRRQLFCAIHWDTGSKAKDALIAEIDDRLVLHGEKQGIDSRQSEQVLDSLLRKVTDLLSAAHDRQLTRADFLRAFDEATMELIPRGEYLALRRLVDQISGSQRAMVGPEATSALIGLQILGAPLPLVRNAIIRTNHAGRLIGANTQVTE